MPTKALIKAIRREQAAVPAMCAIPLYVRIAAANVWAATLFLVVDR